MAQQSNKSSHWPHYRPIAPAIGVPPSSLSPALKSSLERVDGSALDKSSDTLSVGSFTGSLNNTGIVGVGGDTLSVGHKRASSSAPESNQQKSMTAEQRQRRKEQNRAAQRAFRERKERYVKELEAKIKFMEDAHAENMRSVQRENDELRQVIKQMKSELSAFKDLAASYSEAFRKLRESGVDVPEVSVPDITTDEGEEDEDEGEEVTPSASKRIMRVPSSAVACIRDKDGVSFCERLKDEVCSSAFDKLLSEPLFDASGTLNDSVTQRPVPIVTQPISNKDRHDRDWFKREILSESVIVDPATHETKLVSCTELWERLSEHPKFDEFDLDALCEELRNKALCSADGPVLEERELANVLRNMEAKLER